MAEPLVFYDSNVAIGPATAARQAWRSEPEDLLPTMRRLNIQRALVYHTLARSYHPATGNTRTTAFCARHSECRACYVILPHHTGEMPCGPELVDYLRKGAAAAVRLFPGEQNFLLGPTWCGDLLAALEGAGVPLLLEMADARPGEVDDLLTRRRQLNLILLRVGYRMNRMLYPLLEKHPNLHIEISWLYQHMGLEDMVRRFGAERLVFGSGWPAIDPAAAMTPVIYADISETDKRLIASGNLQRILGED